MKGGKLADRRGFPANSTYGASQHRVLKASRTGSHGMSKTNGETNGLLCINLQTIPR